jgi:hypothetical protein
MSHSYISSCQCVIFGGKTVPPPARHPGKTVGACGCDSAPVDRMCVRPLLCRAERGEHREVGVTGRVDVDPAQ